MRQKTHCPACRSVIRPTLIDCLPPRHTRRQYPCPHCGAWLTIDRRTRVIFFGVAIGVLALLVVPGLIYIDEIQRRFPLKQPLFAVLLLGISIVVAAIAATFALRRFASWVVAPGSPFTSVRTGESQSP